MKTNIQSPRGAINTFLTPNHNGSSIYAIILSFQVTTLYCMMALFPRKLGLLVLVFSV